MGQRVRRRNLTYKPEKPKSRSRSRTQNGVDYKIIVEEMSKLRRRKTKIERGSWFFWGKVAFVLDHHEDARDN